MLTTHFGNTNTIKFGGTEIWGRQNIAIVLSKDEGATETDTIVVDNITVDPVGGEDGWCRCTQDGDTLTYTATTANTSSSPRYATFKHKTTDKVIATGINEGREVMSEWWVVVMQDGTGESSQTRPNIPIETVNITIIDNYGEIQVDKIIKMNTTEIKLIGPEVKGRVGEIVTLRT